MTRKLTREERVQDLYCLKVGQALSQSDIENIKMLARMALSCMESEPVAWRRFQETPTDGGYWVFDGDRPNCSGVEPLYTSPQPAPVVQCPFPCGWDNLNKLAIQDAALIARGLVEGEPTTEAHRQAAIANSNRLLKVISACRAAMPSHSPDAGNKVNSPEIPDGSSAMLRRWLAFGRSMQNAGSQLPRNLIAETEDMLAAAPQEVTSARVHPARDE